METRDIRKQLQISAPKIKASAYVIPYQTDSNGNVQALVGQKKVICYKTQEQLEVASLRKDLKKWQPLFDKARNTKFHSCMETRFDGLFYAAGGKPTCFGGRVDKRETPEYAAARELLEETGLQNVITQRQHFAVMNEIITNLVLLHESDSIGFRGIYYSLNLDQCPVLKELLAPEKIHEENLRIEADERAIKKPLRERVESQLAERCSEMHSIQWVNMDKLVEHLGQNPHVGEMFEYINGQIQAGARFFVNQIYPEKTEANIALFKRCRNFLNTHLPDEYIRENVDAARKLSSLFLEKGKGEDKNVEVEAKAAVSPAFFAAPAPPASVMIEEEKKDVSHNDLPPYKGSEL